MKQRADWLTWSLHLIAGLGAGALWGYVLILKRRSFGSAYWLASDQIPIFLCGTAFIGASLASFYGDRLWINILSYRMIPPGEMRHAKNSHILSIGIGVLGALLVTTVLLQHFDVF